MMEQYMNELCKKKTALKTQKKTKIKVIVPNKKVDKKYKKKQDVTSSYKTEAIIRYFTANGKKNRMECKDCDLVLMSEIKKPVYLCKDTSCDLGLCFKCYHELKDIKRIRLNSQLQ